MYITARQAAEKWHISLRTVQHLCKEGRVRGAVRWGRAWMIPEAAERPERGQTKSVNEGIAGDAVLRMPLQNPAIMMTCRYDQSNADIDCTDTSQSAAAILEGAWMAYSHGEIQRSVSMIKRLRSVPADFYGTISIGLLMAACAIWKGDTHLWFEGRSRIMNVACHTAEEKASQEFWLATTDGGLLDNSQFPEWFKKGCHDVLPSDSKPSVMFYYAKHLYIFAKNIAVGKAEFPEVTGLGAMRMLPRLLEPLIAEAKMRRLPFLETTLRCLCAAAYHDLNERKEAVIHLDTALTLALPNKMYGLLAEFRGNFEPFMDERISLMDANAAKHIRELQKEMLEGFSVLNRVLRNIQIVTTLSPRELEIARLAAMGLSNMEIADRLQISLSSVKTMITRIMNKTDTKKRTEFSSYLF